MNRIARFLTALSLATVLAIPAILLAGMNGDSVHRPDIGNPADVVPDEPGTMPDDMGQDGRALPNDGGDAAGDAPLDRHDPRCDNEGLPDPLDEPANIPAPGM